MSNTRYVRERTLNAGMPFGGLGTGSMEIREDGRLHDWEIFNNGLWAGDAANRQPDQYPEDAGCCLRFQPRGKPPTIRWLHHGTTVPNAASTSFQSSRIYNFPFMRDIERIIYSGRYPIAELSYEDSALPLSIRLEAFSPFLVGNAEDSALPLAYFQYTIKNVGSVPGSLLLAMSLRNAVGWDRRERVRLRNEVVRHADAVSVAMTGEDLDPEAASTGSLCLTAFDARAEHLIAWTDDRGLAGFDNADTPGYGHFAHSMLRGALPGGPEQWQREVRITTASSAGCCGGPRPPTRHWRGSLASTRELGPGEECVLRFALTWHFPNQRSHQVDRPRVGHHYARRFEDALAVSRYAVRSSSRLENATRAFHACLGDTTLEPWLVESLASQLTIFPEASWWTENGELGVWEGKGCCQVIAADRTLWSSWQPLLFFPELYADMTERLADPEAFDSDPTSFMRATREERRLEQQEKRGDLGGWLAERYADFASSDPNFGKLFPKDMEGGAIMLLRDYMWTGRASLLRTWWPRVRTGLEATLDSDVNGDGLPDGALTSMTYDHWFMPPINCYRGTMWLGELMAAARLARLRDEPAAVTERFEAALERGRASFETLLFNGRSYDLAWDEHRQKRDRGSMADQVSGQLYPRLLGLGSVHPEANVQSALRAVFETNFVHEQGLLNGVDREERDDWTYFARYSREGADERLGGQWVTPWTGTEHYVAATMIAEGLVDEGLAILRDIHQRHVAFGQVNSHVECGEHYFRGNALWACLFALQGLRFDRTRDSLSVAPKITPAAHRSPLLLPGIFGTLSQVIDADGLQVTIRLASGELALRELGLACHGQIGHVKATLDGLPIELQGHRDGEQYWVVFSGPFCLRAGASLEVRASSSK